MCIWWYNTSLEVVFIMHMLACDRLSLQHGDDKNKLVYMCTVYTAIFVNICLYEIWGEHSLMNVSTYDPLFVYADVVVLMNT